jgi:anaerobic selenocysteine-containing dehydrogenase
VLIEIGTRLGLPGLIDEDGAPRYPNGYADYLVGHERKPGVGSLAGWRGHNGSKQGVGAPNPDQLQAYIEHDCHWRHEMPEAARYFRYANRAYLEWAQGLGFIDHAAPITLQLYSEPLQKFRLAAEGHGAIQPPDELRPRIAAHFDPLPIWYPPFEDAGAGEDFPLHAVTQRPMAMYHAWGSQNAWLRQIHAANRLYMSRTLAAKLGIADDDWVWVESRKGQVKAQARLMDGVNEHTVWTWNAIGKRAGAWNLGEGAPESRKGFLLNHLIDDLQAAGGLSNSDPITGQAAWYDLRVRVRKAGLVEAGTSAPIFATLRRPPGMQPAPETLQYGKKP